MKDEGLSKRAKMGLKKLDEMIRTSGKNKITLEEAKRLLGRSADLILRELSNKGIVEGVKSSKDAVCYSYFVVKRESKEADKMPDGETIKDIGQIEKEVSRNSQHCKPLFTLLNKAMGKKVKVIMLDGEILRGVLQNFSLHEVQVDNRIVWKQVIKYLEIVN